MSIEHAPVPDALARRLREDPIGQRPFAWKLEKWLPIVVDEPAAQAVLRSMPGQIDREAVRQVVQQQLDVRHGVAAFIPVMIWGGPGGYGPFRARSILTGSRSRENTKLPIDSTVGLKLLEGARVARAEGALEAFRLLNNEGHIPYLGGAFFTKWISFASARSSTDSEEVAPILDKRVSDWIYEQTRATSPISLSTSSTADYARYLALLDMWRRNDAWARTRVQVELAIFDLTRDRPDDRIDL